MGDTEIFHIEPTHERMGGRRQGQGQSHHRRHELVQSLFEALEAQNLDHARLVFQQLVNTDVNLLKDPDLAQVNKLLHEGQIYAALHFAKEWRLRQVSAQHFAAQPAPIHSANRSDQDARQHLSMTSTGTLAHLVDLKA